ncbi:CapA family protein [Virgibacillus sp. W0181]|uniref:CapA family protein n=1 Tax=Virgibacillus sp. W0181 TaxID=3391581 RepID=UPI003F48F61C
MLIQSRKWIYISVLFICILLVACSNENENVNMELEDEQLSSQETEKEQNAEKPIKEPVKKEITISAIGDMLIHSRVYKDAKVDEGYDFMPMLQPVKKYLDDTTITFANQETMIGGVDLGLSTYPSFNSPKAVGDALKEVGVNVVSLANNHTLDRGNEAIQSAISHWETIDMMYVGAYKDQQDRDELRIYETEEGISVAFLAYTYGTNGIPVPEGKDFLVNLIDKEIIGTDIEDARGKADAVILSLHFGNEYERMPSEEQKDLVQFAADKGVHAVFGHHPHVLQPVDWVEGKEGNQTLVAYSLGNFLSGQDELYRQIGGVLKFTIQQTIDEDEKTIQVMSPKFLPTYVDVSNETDYRVWPMFQVANDVLPEAGKHYNEIKEHMSQWMPELEFIEE